MIRSYCLAFYAIALWPLYGVDYHVAPNGNDRNPGSKERPFATLTRARGAVRELKAKGPLQAPVNVYLRGGVYYLAETLMLEPQDSGTANAPITWQAAPGESVLLSGARPITSEWKTEDGRIWYTDIPEIRDAGIRWEEYKRAERERMAPAGRWHFRQLFVDGKRQTRARFPNASLPDPYLYSASATNEKYMPAPKGSVKAAWGKEPDAQIWAQVSWNGYNVICDITGADPARDRISVFDPTGRWRISGDEKESYDKPDWFFVEGIREELDEPGEWYLDPLKGRLYYWPPGGTMKGKTVEAPRLDTVILLAGDPVAGTHVDHLRFQGLKIAHTRYSMQHPEPRISIDGAVILRNARHCRVEKCEISGAGGNAIWLQYDSQDNVITGNHLHDLGSAGVLSTGARFAWMQDESVFNPDRAVWKYSPVRTTITHNKIERCSQVYVYGPGVFIDSAPMRLRYKQHAYIAHNEIIDTGKKAVFLYQNVGNTVVEYNKASISGWRVRDTGVFYTVCNNDENGDQIYVLNNSATDIPGQFDGKYGGRRMFGILYVDHASHLQHFENNFAGGQIEVDSMIQQNMLGGTFPKSVAYGGNVWKNGPRHAALDLDNVGPGPDASNRIEIEQDLGVAAEWWEPDVVKRSGAWEEYLEGTVGTGGMAGVIKTTTRLLKSAGPPTEEQALEFQLPVIRKGVYRAFVYFRHNDANAASNVPVTVYHKGGATTVPVDQRKQYAHANARWHGYPVGVYEFEAGTGKIRIGTHGARGAVYVSGAALVRDKLYIVDNDNPLVRKLGSWESAGTSGTGAHYGDDYLVAQSSANAALVQYPFSHILEDARYDLYVWHKEGGPEASSRTRVTINHAEGVRTVTLDQRTGGSRWRHIGSYRLAPGAGHDVRIGTAGADGKVIADAVKAVRVGGPQ